MQRTTKSNIISIVVTSGILGVCAFSISDRGEAPAPQSQDHSGHDHSFLAAGSNHMSNSFWSTGKDKGREESPSIQGQPSFASVAPNINKKPRKEYREAPRRSSSYLDSRNYVDDTGPLYGDSAKRNSRKDDARSRKDPYWRRYYSDGGPSSRRDNSGTSQRRLDEWLSETNGEDTRSAIRDRSRNNDVPKKNIRDEYRNYDSGNRLGSFNRRQREESGPSGYRRREGEYDYPYGQDFGEEQIYYYYYDPDVDSLSLGFNSHQPHHLEDNTVSDDVFLYDEAGKKKLTQTDGNSKKSKSVENLIISKDEELSLNNDQKLVPNNIETTSDVPIKQKEKYIRVEKFTEDEDARKAAEGVDNEGNSVKDPNESLAEGVEEEEGEVEGSDEERVAVQTVEEGEGEEDADEKSFKEVIGNKKKGELNSKSMSTASETAPGSKTPSTSEVEVEESEEEEQEKLAEEEIEKIEEDEEHERIQESLRNEVDDYQRLKPDIIPYRSNVASIGQNETIASNSTDDSLASSHQFDSATTKQTSTSETTPIVSTTTSTTTTIVTTTVPAASTTGQVHSIFDGRRDDYDSIGNKSKEVLSNQIGDLPNTQNATQSSSHKAENRSHPDTTDENDNKRKASAELKLTRGPTLSQDAKAISSTPMTPEVHDQNDTKQEVIYNDEDKVKANEKIVEEESTEESVSSSKYLKTKRVKAKTNVNEVAAAETPRGVTNQQKKGEPETNDSGSVDTEVEIGQVDKNLTIRETTSIPGSTLEGEEEDSGTNVSTTAAINKPTPKTTTTSETATTKTLKTEKPTTKTTAADTATTETETTEKPTSRTITTETATVKTLKTEKPTTKATAADTATTKTSTTEKPTTKTTTTVTVIKNVLNFTEPELEKRYDSEKESKTGKDALTVESSSTQGDNQTTFALKHEVTIDDGPVSLDESLARNTSTGSPVIKTNKVDGDGFAREQRNETNPEGEKRLVDTVPDIAAFKNDVKSGEPNVSTVDVDPQSTSNHSNINMTLTTVREPKVEVATATNNTNVQEKEHVRNTTVHEKELEQANTVKNTTSREPEMTIQTRAGKRWAVEGDDGKAINSAAASRERLDDRTNEEDVDEPNNERESGNGTTKGLQSESLDVDETTAGAANESTKTTPTNSTDVNESRVDAMKGNTTSKDESKADVVGFSRFIISAKSQKSEQQVNSLKKTQTNESRKTDEGFSEVTRNETSFNEKIKSLEQFKEPKIVITTTNITAFHDFIITDLVKGDNPKVKQANTSNSINQSKMGNDDELFKKDNNTQSISSIQPETKSEEKIEEKSEEKIEDASENKPDEKIEEKSENKAEKKTEEKSENKPEEKIEDKSENNAEKKTEEKSENKPEEKTEEKLDNEAEKKIEQKPENKSETEHQSLSAAASRSKPPGARDDRQVTNNSTTVPISKLVPQDLSEKADKTPDVESHHSQSNETNGNDATVSSSNGTIIKHQRAENSSQSPSEATSLEIVLPVLSNYTEQEAQLNFSTPEANRTSDSQAKTPDNSSIASSTVNDTLRESGNNGDMLVPGTIPDATKAEQKNDILSSHFETIPGVVRSEGKNDTHSSHFDTTLGATTSEKNNDTRSILGDIVDTNLELDGADTEDQTLLSDEQRFNDTDYEEIEIPETSAYMIQDFTLRKADHVTSQQTGVNAKDEGTPNKGSNSTKSSNCPHASCAPPPPPPLPRAQAAMSAVLTSHFGPTKERIIPFDLELLDLADNYDNTTGIFICTIPGTYVISVYLMSHPGAKVNARVFINNRPVAALWADDSKGAGFYPSSSIQTIVQLGFGDQVYVMLVDAGYGESWVHANYNVFTVFLLYEQTF